MLTSNHGLDPKLYYEEAIFLKERDLLFANLWIFVGVLSFVAGKDSYICRKIASTSVFIQNDGVKLRAFINICPHRLSPIRAEGFGQKKITCPYHGWSFDSGGRLKIIPNSELYNFEPVQLESVKLVELNVKTIGQFIFINFSSNPVDINEQFTNDLLADIETVSHRFDSKIIYGNFPANYNWKLNVEVIKDPNHIPFVHPRTFMPWLKKVPRDEVVKKHKVPWQDVSNTKLTDLSFRTEGSVVDSNPWYRSLIDRLGSESKHISWYLYPNTTFSSVRGDYFFIQHYDPTSAADFDFHLWLTTARRIDSKSDFTPLLKALMIAEREVIEEDVQILSQIQRNFNAFTCKPFHGAYEADILRQNSWYANTIFR
jgi:phenylpropionate dioxygenase-like ring-hydroxylating dioxygenase large terminal subunit